EVQLAPARRIARSVGVRACGAPPIARCCIGIAEPGMRICEPRLNRNRALESEPRARNVSRGEQHTAQRLIGEWERRSDPLRLSEPAARAGAVAHLRRNLPARDDA